MSFAWTSRGHGQRPMLAIDCSSMAITATLSLGCLDVILHAEVVGPALEAGNEARHAREAEKSDGDDQAEEPVGLPERGLHELSLSPCRPCGDASLWL